MSVPVLSNATKRSEPARSSASRFRISRPFFAARAVAFAVTSGIARPSACGQAITRTVTASATEPVRSRPTPSQTSNVAVAAPTAMYASQPAARSARRWKRPREARASSTRRITWLSAVSSPVRTTRTVSAPFWFTEPAATSSPGDFDTGVDSPVRNDSSAAESPSSTSPSAGNDSPGRTSRRSPSSSSDGATSSVPPSSR